MEPDHATDRLRLSVIATPLAARQAVSDLCSHVAKSGVAPARMEDIRIVLAEVLNNIVEHAYRPRAPGRIRVSVAATPELVEIELSDFGTPLPTRSLSARTLPPPNPDDLPEGGFGWHLIRTLADQVAYERRAGCNHLSLRFELPEHNASVSQ
ncbi:ATP-binding protein [Ruegeria hyattellae]|uniref:ATP-binding protein n=1 Tax=Ruegeria hyattellae TaxID=3233337 RepID=UPI00355BF258